jgi:hypothetical protein
VFLSVGDTLELPYALDGHVPAGCAHLRIASGQGTMGPDGALHVDIVAKLAGTSMQLAGLDRAIAAVTPYMIDGTTITGAVEADFQLPSIAPAAGDQLVVRATVSPTTDPVKMYVFLDLPP